MSVRKNLTTLAMYATVQSRVPWGLCMDLIETGLEPEFFITDIVRTEPAGNGSTMRLYVACLRHGHPVVQFTVVAAIADITKMAQQILEISSRQMGGDVWSEFTGLLKAH